MERTSITIHEYCSYHQLVEPQFIEALLEHGLIRPVAGEAEPAIYLEELGAVESYSRMHYDLEINVAGIENIMHLLERMRALQDELDRLRRMQGRGAFALPDTP